MFSYVYIYTSNKYIYTYIELTLGGGCLLGVNNHNRYPPPK